MKPKLLVLLAVPALILFFLAVALVGNSWLRGFLRGPEFRELISEQTSSALRVSGEFTPLVWTGFAVYTPEFRGEGIPGGPVASFKAEQIRTELLWREAFAGVWKLDGISIGRLNLVLGEEAGKRHPHGARAPVQDSDEPRLPAWLPRKFDPGEIRVESAIVEFGQGAVRGTSGVIKQHGKGWEVETRGGRFEWPGMPANDFRESRCRLTQEGFFLTSATMLLRAGGQVDLNGEIPSGGGTVQLQVRWSEVPVREIFPGGKKSNLEGKCSGEARVVVAKGGEPRVDGSFMLRDGQLHDLPVLSLIGRFTGASRFDPLAVNELSGNFQRQAGILTVENFVMESKGLLRVEGSLEYADTGELRGVLQVGLTSSTLQWLPGSRERVFRDASDGYLWTTVHVGGTAQKPTEDLSGRLLGAMGEQAISTGAEVVEGAADTAVEGVRGILELFNPLGD